MLVAIILVGMAVAVIAGSLIVKAIFSTPERDLYVGGVVKTVTTEAKQHTKRVRHPRQSRTVRRQTNEDNPEFMRHVNARVQELERNS